MFQSFLKIWPFIKTQKRLLIASILLSIPMSAISSAPAVLVKYLIDKILVHPAHGEKGLEMVFTFSAGIVIVYSLNFIVRFSFNYSSRLANERIMRDLREALFKHYISLSTTFFNQTSVGGLMSKIMNDVFYVSQYVINLSSFFRQIFTFLAVFGYALYLNPKLVGFILVVAPGLIWLSGRTGNLMKHYSLQMQEANAEVFSILQEGFSGFKVIKSFCLETRVFQKFCKKNDRYVDYALRAARVQESASPTVELIGAVALAFVIYVGGRDVLHGRMTPGDLSAFFACFALMINPVQTFNDLILKFNQAAAAADSIDDALKLVSNVEQAKAFKPFPETRKVDLKFHDVGFRYSKEQPWLFQELNFSVLSGQTIAIVGASGQGKSTLLSLVPRFYDPELGHIELNGVNIRDLSLNDLRKNVAMVTQDVFLFNDSIYENILAGRPEATQAEVFDAAKTAHALRFIEKLPQGWDTCVGERGTRLSGGERQRIAIARALLKDAPLLILDEATSSLDSESEKNVQIALDELMRGRTSLIVAHRLSTVRHADQILVMQGGTFVERGTHKELISDKEGVYSKFYALLS